jgi:N-acyl-D-aspartate/D-glutamate deacylase
VRDEKVLTLKEALRRMTIEPARRLEARVPEMRERGRIRVNAFADITIFDPATVSDQSTYGDAAQYSRGIVHVFVNGVSIVRDGGFDDRQIFQGQRLLLGTRTPGRPIRAPRR